MKTFTYLAIAYSGLEVSSFEESKKAVLIYSNDGLVVYSPIVHFHPVADQYKLPKSYQHWVNNAQGMIRGCSALDILVPEGWGQCTRESQSVIAEVRYAHGRGIPVRVVTIIDDDKSTSVIGEPDDGEALRDELLGGM